MATDHPAHALRLRPLGPDDEAEFLAANEAMVADGFHFGLNYDEGMDWMEYVQRNRDFRRNINLPEELVPAAFLVADVGGAIVGRTSIRFELNDWLAHQGGHIGYGVLGEHRRQGFATEILRQSLIIARSEGIERSLVCCDDTNLGSAEVIQRCGGVLDNIVEGDTGKVRRYWIP